MSQWKLIKNILPIVGNRRNLFQKVLRTLSSQKADVNAQLKNVNCESTIDNLIVYNSYVNYLDFLERKNFIKKRSKQVDNGQQVRPLSVTLRYIQSEESEKSGENPVSHEEITESVNFPYSLKVSDEEKFISEEESSSHDESDVPNTKEEYESMDKLDHTFQFAKYGKKWMNDYEQYTEEDEESGFEEWRYDYGTANPKTPVSKIPCGGCGAFLHCQDSAIPGYLPSEIFLQCDKKDLLKITCQRCHFLKHYNTFLTISVDKNLYPTLLARIKEKKALVLLMVDLTDFPCSIWPGILDIIGKNRPLFIVGNKVDLLWSDCKSWMDNVKNVLRSTFPSNANILHVSLISAKTGFGIEQLINKLHLLWRYKGDVYLIGCTNVGKSTLFNALLQSDYCKVKAADLMQRATTSPWPGTTLNLLKFPILRPEGWRLYLRTLRLMDEQKKTNYENKIRKELIKSTKMKETTPAQLIGHIGRTFTSSPTEGEVEDADNFTAPNRKHLAEARILGSGIDPNDPDFAKSKWFYDTPGVLHKDQILDLLTTEEIMMTIPKTIIRPRTFLIRPGWTLFIAGLARLDFTEGDKAVRLTVFSSTSLPITICTEENADQVYNNLLGSKYMVVPSGSEERLKEWPNLQKANNIISLLGINSYTSCADIVLSSAGWISVTADVKEICKFVAWTPLGRGVHVRIPPLLPNAVNLRGKKVARTPAYGKSTPFRS